MTKRILHIIATLDRGGAEKQLTLLAGGLDRSQFETHVCALTRGGPLEAELRAAEIPVTVIGKRGKYNPLALWRLYRFIRQLQPDLVQTWMFTANSYGRVAARWAKVGKLVASERCIDRWKHGLHLYLDRWLARRTDRIVVNAPGIRDWYVGHGLPADKFAVIPNAVAPTKPSTATCDELLAGFGLPADTRFIGCVGRLWPQKRLKDAIWAAELLKAIRDDVHLLIIGEGPQRGALELFIRQTELTDRVHLLGHREDVPRLLSHFDCLWLVSEYEGLPNSIMEAMAAGVPVVATDISGNRDLVVEGQTGYLVPLGDCAAIARATRRILDDAELAMRLGAAARERIAAEFSLEKMLDAYTRLYRELLDF